MGETLHEQNVEKRRVQVKGAAGILIKFKNDCIGGRNSSINRFRVANRLLSIMARRHLRRTMGRTRSICTASASWFRGGDLRAGYNTNEFLPDLRKQGLEVGICFDRTTEGPVVQVDKVIADIENELSKTKKALH